MYWFDPPRLLFDLQWSTLLLLLKRSQVALSLRTLHSEAAVALVAVILAVFLQDIHMLHHLLDPWFIIRHTESPATPGHQNHGTERAALPLDLLMVVCKNSLFNCFVFDRQATVHGYLRQCRCAAVDDKEDAEEEFGITPRSHAWSLSW